METKKLYNSLAASRHTALFSSEKKMIEVSHATYGKFQVG